MFTFFKLIRIPNLLIIALTQYLLKYCIIVPFLKQYNLTTIFSHFNFSLLVLSTVFIAAAGYLINDFYDIKTDYINKPEKNENTLSINKNTLFIIYYVLNALGLGLGVYISYSISNIEFSVVFFLIVGLLWFYSTTYKKQLFISNLIVALLTAFVPVIVLMYEFPPIMEKYAAFLLKNGLSIGYIKTYILGYGGFAFITTLIREIIKDTEDFEGDFLDNRNSIPVIFGIITTKIVIICLIVVFIFLISFIYIKYIYIGLYPTVYLLATIIFPSIWVVVKIIKAKDKNNYHLSSSLIKFIMVAGVLFMLILRYSIEL